MSAGLEISVMAAINIPEYKNAILFLKDSILGILFYN